MATLNQVSTIEEKACLLSPVLPTKEVTKVDEQLTIEFTVIKQEPKYFDHYQKFQQFKDEKKPKCISCDPYFENPGPSDGMATIHETCFLKLCAKLYIANVKVEDSEVAKTQMVGTIEKLEGKNKELHEKLTRARKEIQDITKEKKKR